MWVWVVVVDLWVVEEMGLRINNNDILMKW